MTFAMDSRDSGATLIRASAGTGKTHRLGQRYFQLLAAGVSPDRILATTFTRKAAGEIQDRVLGTLAGAVLGNPKSLAFIPGLTQESAARMLAQSLSILHRFGIGTLDSFFIRTATAFTLELELPPGWGILDEHDAAALRDDAIRAMLHSSPPQKIIDLVRMLHPGKAKRGVHAQVASVVGSLHKLFQHQPDESAWCWLQPPPITRPTPIEAWSTELTRLESLIPTKKDGDRDQRWVKAIQSNLKSARAEDWLAFIRGGLAGKIISGLGEYYGKEIPAPIIEAYRPMLDHATSVLLGQLAQRTRSAYELLRDYDRHFQQLKSDRRAYRFEDVTRQLVKGRIDGRLDELYYRIDGRIDHMLLDEFQDTSLDQWTILKPIADELRSTEGRSLLCVGDVKQAIYGWRGGVAEIFATLEREFGEVHREELIETRRCRPAIVETVNHLFTHIADRPATLHLRDAVNEWSQGFTQHTTACHDTVGFVQARVARKAADGDRQDNATLAQAAALVRDLCSQSPGRTIGVLVRTNRAVARVIFELRQLGVFASEEGGNTLDDSPGVSVVLSLLRLCDHPVDSAAAFHVAQSPLGPRVGITRHDDAESISRAASRIRRELLEMGYGTTIDRWVEWLAPECDARSLRRLTQLTELAHRCESVISLRPGDFVRRVEGKQVEDPAGALVRVMTVHKAKGLGFDIVVLPELDGLLAQVQKEGFLTDRPSRVEPPDRIVCYPDESIQSLDERLIHMHDQAVTTLAIGELCVFYVMMTRAKYALHFLIAPSKFDAKGDETFPRTYAGILRGALFGDKPVQPGELIYQTGDAHWHKDKNLEPARTAAEPDESDPPIPRLAPSVASRSRMLPRRIPSSTKGFASGFGFSGAGPGAKEARKRGGRIHELLAEIEWLARNKTPHAELLPYLKGTNTRQLFERDTFPSDLDITVVREEPFLIRHDGAIVHGIIDRLILIRRGGVIESAQIIDFKTDAISPDALRDLVEQYRPQLQAYARAVATLHRLDPAKITSRLAFLSLDRVVDL